MGVGIVGVRKETSEFKLRVISNTFSATRLNEGQRLAAFIGTEPSLKLNLSLTCCHSAPTPAPFDVFFAKASAAGVSVTPAAAPVARPKNCGETSHLYWCLFQPDLSIAWLVLLKIQAAPTQWAPLEPARCPDSIPGWSGRMRIYPCAPR